eukprot:GHVP01053977.1.p1 GENE.GHVP01053977.1~~GHVP01053977.1.p1  ORF type:complete len:352 (+),score=54.11 GHVP01053977.1:1394-2449(+)
MSRDVQNVLILNEEVSRGFQVHPEAPKKRCTWATHEFDNLMLQQTSILTSKQIINVEDGSKKEIDFSVLHFGKLFKNFVRSPFSGILSGILSLIVAYALYSDRQNVISKEIDYTHLNNSTLEFDLEKDMNGKIFGYIQMEDFYDHMKAFFYSNPPGIFGRLYDCKGAETVGEARLLRPDLTIFQKSESSAVILPCGYGPLFTPSDDFSLSYEKNEQNIKILKEDMIVSEEDEHALSRISKYFEVEKERLLGHKESKNTFLEWTPGSSFVRWITSVYHPSGDSTKLFQAGHFPEGLKSGNKYRITFEKKDWPGQNTKTVLLTTASKFGNRQEMGQNIFLAISVSFFLSAVLV